MYLQTRGLVIREVEYSESDKLLTVLTPEHGALTLKARGVRRSSSPLKAACQLLCYSSFTASSYQNYYSITEAEPVEMFLPLRQAIALFDRRLHGFADPQSVLTGVETRSSSPVRLPRDGRCEALGIRGLYPAGEGAGYAGGILSAAADGLRCAEWMLVD